jgi:D-lactate dehydrogenase (quinone)
MLSLQCRFSTQRQVYAAYCARTATKTEYESSLRKSASNTVVQRLFSTSAESATAKDPSFQWPKVAAAAALFGAGYAVGRFVVPKEPCTKEQSVLPNGLPRTCCDSKESARPLTEEQFHLAKRLKNIVGDQNVHDGRTLDTVTAPFLTPARVTGYGGGAALCIVTPRHLHHVADVVEAALAADCTVLVQGQNTGLTGGSVPRSGEARASQRPVVLLSLKHLDAIFPIDDGKRVVCLAGVGLASVSQLTIYQLASERYRHALTSLFASKSSYKSFWKSTFPTGNHILSWVQRF